MSRVYSGLLQAISGLHHEVVFMFRSSGYAVIAGGDRQGAENYANYSPGTKV